MLVFFHLWHRLTVGTRYYVFQKKDRPSRTKPTLMAHALIAAWPLLSPFSPPKDRNRSAPCPLSSSSSSPLTLRLYRLRLSPLSFRIADLYLYFG
jgi:hypothetical protein